MAPVSGRRGAELSLDDCRCPVCLEIFMEPVTLPCTHTFCKECFLESVDKATLCCPLCRKRVSTWARQNSRNNTLVNQKLWTHIQTSFPLQCQRRQNGQDAIAEDDPAVSVSFPRVSQPGELKREYEDQVTKLTEERRALDEAERRASEEYIQRLLQEEEELLQVERRRREDDERLARLLSNQLNSAPVAPPDVTPTHKKKKKEVSGGHMERFLCPLPSSSSSSSDCSFVANKENILVSAEELQKEPALPELDYYGLQTDRSPPPSVAEEDQLHPGTLKRKSSELYATEDKEVSVSKQGCPSSLEVVTEWEVELLRRRQQEEEDRRLALLLQKELDQEEKLRATDRSKGSSDPYLLRQTSRGREETASSDSSRSTSTNTTSASSTSTSTSKTSTPSSTKTSSSMKTSSSTRTPSSAKKSSSSTPSSRGRKQATLTEMFSSLSS
ncbi:E3 ubiquitin-protein ligase rnf168 isoform X2 [Plectropomus leopardus]|uniref:E3 ubiquitin-protein ligase rnf168 isoform X2 n=1 Tax=Plectropomus leopardus TaxID=160734 RepID=UPI001C4B07DF|nr:E3 ubiquitin-protein ligase rnf168 isoform X2 [Plectropomus leopardus]